MKPETTLRVAAAQMNSQDDLEQNLASVEVLVARAAEQSAKLVLLPENFAYFGPESGRRKVAERMGDVEAPIQRTLARLARQSGCTIVAGGFPEAGADSDRPYNTCAVFGPDGRVSAAYRKIHLFDVELPDGSKLCESSDTYPGSEAVVVPIGEFRVGLSICYDLRFPELYRALVGKGADVLVVPAAFTLLTGKDHWHVLLRARAIESQAWLVAAGQWGKHPKGRTTYGHSLVVDPWGLVVSECSDRVGLAVADIDRAYLEQVRTSLPSLKHRRL